MSAFKFISLIIAASALSVSAQTPTWSDNVACIVYTHCAGCHNPNGIAQFSLITYQEAYNARGIMWSSVNTRKMPPWPPDPSYQTYAHERKLTQEEIDIFNAWVNADAPQGDPANAPVPPVFEGGSELQQVDLTFRMPDYTNPATKDDYRCFVIPLNLAQDMFITGWEVVPGNRNMVHHVLVYQDTSNAPIQMDNNDPGPGYSQFGGVGSSTAKLIGGWVPGSGPSFLPADMGIKLMKNANIIMQMHYPAGTSGQDDSTRVNMTLSTDPNIRSVTLAPILNHITSITEQLYIPANTVKTFYEEYTIPADVTVLSVAPHMHLVGTSIKSYAVTPVNDTIPLVKIDNWDFHWQGAYAFRKPIKIPQFSTLHAEAVYDNTAANPNNPNNPPQDVARGEATTDEMMLVYFSFLVYENGDENIVVDTVTAVHPYNDCNYKLATVTGINETGEYAIRIYPNPVESFVNIENPQLKSLTAELYDVTGKRISSQVITSGSTKLMLNVADGMYYIKLVNEQGAMVTNQPIIKL